MSKAITGAALMVAAVGAEFFTFGADTPLTIALYSSVFLSGVSMEAGAIASALTSNRGMGITTRQAAAYRQVIYGEQRVGGITIYESTTGSSHDQYNYVIVLAGHEIDSIVNLYLDGRQVFWHGSGGGWSVRNGVGFGGIADGADHTGPDGNQYNFGGTGHSGIYCEARYGDQSPGDVIGGLTANDGNWAADGHGNSPWVAGCAYVYLKIEYNPSLFPNAPEIKFTVRGKNNILDPRTGTRGWTANSALCIADVITDTEFGLGDVDAFKDSGSLGQLIAAANVCDEQVLVQALSSVTPTYESRYTTHHHYDCASAPGSVLEAMLESCGGRISMPGGEWYIFPAYWQGPASTFDQAALSGPLRWAPNRSQKDLCNRVAGTYTAANYPFNIAGNLYDANGFYDGGLQNNFPFAFQPTDFPAYAADALHGYAADEYLNQDSGLLGPWSSAAVYGIGDVVSLGSGTSLVMYKSLVGSNLNNNPATDAAAWVAYSNLLPVQLNLPTVLSVTQAQRLAKIKLLRNRQQGSGELSMMQRAFVMQCCDVMEFTFAAMGWTEKVLEIVAVKCSLTEGEADQAPMETLEYSVIETAASVYEWDPTSEELTVYDAPATPNQQNRAVAPPTGMSLTSGAATAVIGADGVVHPRIEVQWTTPADVLATQIEIQYALVTGGVAGPWSTAAYVNAALNLGYIPNVVAGAVYDVRIASLRSSGAMSVWVEIDGYTVSVTLSSLMQLALAPSSLTGEAFAPVSFTGNTTSGSAVVASVSSTAGLVVGSAVSGAGLPLGTLIASIGSGTLTLSIAATATASTMALTADGAAAILPGYGSGSFTAVAGNVSVTVSPGNYPLAVPGQGQLYFVYYVDPTFAGGAVTAIATQNQADYLNRVGYFLIDSVVTPVYVSGGGGGGGGGGLGLVPTSYTDAGSFATVGPTEAYPGGTYARVSDGPSDDGNCTWQGFSGITSSAMTLSVTAQFISSGAGSAYQAIGYRLTSGGIPYYWESTSAAVAKTTYTVAIPSGTDLSGVQVFAISEPSASAGTVEVSNINIF